MKKNVFGIILIFLFLSSIKAQTAWIQVGKSIIGEAAEDHSGASISLSADGSILAIGAPYNSGSGYETGQVRIYRNESGSWNRIGSDIDGLMGNHESGSAISLSADGSTVAIGAKYSNQVRVFRNNSDSWIQIGNSLSGDSGDDQFGISVSLSADGNILAVGAPYNSGNGTSSGCVYIYKYIDGNWSRIGKILGDNSYCEIGGSISLSGNGSILSVGALGHSGFGSNVSSYVTVYKNTDGTWQMYGNDLNNGSLGQFTCNYINSLSADGSTIGIVNYRNYKQYVNIYKVIDGYWTQQGTEIEEEWSYDGEISFALNADGSKIAIGWAIFNGNGNNTGRVRIFQNSSNNWLQIGQDIYGSNVGECSGNSVCLNNNGSIVAIGVSGNAENGSFSGAARVFTNTTTELTSLKEESNLVFPNPTNGLFKINSLKNSIKTVEITDITGKMVFKISGNQIGSTNQIDISYFEKGIYILIIQKGNEKFTTKIVKK